ncbi:hypothetical protein BD289DRAFT_407969 [Coniella lustricola]|uniref:Ketoreductase domain-containing protein n=1 Tax=Coniella lustricola TaxID=2025994 RepID=A0A2T3AA97_9PEZI|nr:hypothetical protein BD289DRAFT_407969 [Coniella lustricola]
MASPKTYLIAGCSRGLGHSLALAALKAGQKVIATSRNPEASSELVQEVTSLGGHWATLDVASTDLESQFKHILDVLINNAGIATGAVVEQMDLEASRSIFETNFWGLFRLCQLAIPVLKTQGATGGGGGGGRSSIVNISSTNALFPLPVLSVYSASKAAVDAFTLSLAMEVAHFGIRVLLITPAGMRTPFVQSGGASHDPKKLLPEDYHNTQVEAIANMVVDMGNFVIDPLKAAQTIVQAVDGTGPFEKMLKDFVRVPLGAKSLDALQIRSGELTGSLEAFSGVAKSVDLEE